jgi:hypothetical protein
MHVFQPVDLYRKSKDATANCQRFQEGLRRWIMPVYFEDVDCSDSNFLGLESGHSLLFEVEMFSGFQNR